MIHLKYLIKNFSESSYGNGEGGEIRSIRFPRDIDTIRELLRLPPLPTTPLIPTDKMIIS